VITASGDRENGRVQVEDAPQLRSVKQLFAAYPCPYWIAGGWAVDLHVGRPRREHADVDVLILAADLETFARVFADRGVAIDDHQTGERRSWASADEVEPGRHTLALLDTPGVEVLLALSDGPDWVFHRGRRLRRALADITHTSPGGLPYVGPELVLLFKSRDPRDKDEQDFRDLAHLLTLEQRQWLAPRLSPPGGADHPWRQEI
jgi:Aminoglycoside-2''-adenylyltransferase